MIAIVKQMKWQFLLLHRNSLIVISIAVTISYSVLFYLIKGLGNMEKLLTLFILNDPAIIGLFFFGFSVILEKNERVLSALYVSPMKLHHFLISKVLSLSIVGWGCGLGMGIAMLGFNFNLFHFSMGVFATCMLSCMIGILIISSTTDFLLFMLKSIPMLLVSGLPLLNYFELTNIGLFYFLPFQGGIYLISNSYSANPNIVELISGYVSISAWIAIIYLIAYRLFKSKIIAA